MNHRPGNLMFRRPACWSLLVAGALGWHPALAQGSRIEHVVHPVAIDSGPIDNNTDRPVVVFFQEVEVPGAPSLRLLFDAAILDGASYVRITSALDGQSQRLDQRTMTEWRNTTAYFNGSFVALEMVAGPRTQGNRIALTRVLGQVRQVVGAEARVCLNLDLRTPSADARTARLLAIQLPVGPCKAGLPCGNVQGRVCTGWITDQAIWNDPQNRCMISAAHCWDPVVMGPVPGMVTVAQFEPIPWTDVPTCGIRHPPVAKQFVIARVHLGRSSVPGQDWAVFVCNRNPVTNLTVGQEQGASFALGAPIAGVAVTKYGYGAKGVGVGNNPWCVCVPGAPPAQLHLTQQTSAGLIRALVGTLVCHDVPDCGGDSGEPLVSGSGVAVAIGEYGACPPADTPGCPAGLPAPRNGGTSVMHPGLQAALAAETRPPPPPWNGVLTNGPGRGTISVKLDGWGNFGSCPQDQATRGDLFYTDLAGTPNLATTCYSAVLLYDSANCGTAQGYQAMALRDAFYPQFPSQSYNPAVTVVVPNRHVRTANPATVCGTSVSIDQQLIGPDADGSTLVQTYTIQNNTASVQWISLIRFVDGDLGGATGYPFNRAGASRRLADCGLGAPPFESNAQWVFMYDPTYLPNAVIGISAEGRDATGGLVIPAAYRVICSSAGHPVADLSGTPVAFNTNMIDNDPGGTLLTDAPAPTCDYAMTQRLDFEVAAAGTVVGVFRTRLTELNVASAASLQTRSRDAGCISQGGSYSGSGSGALLCVNGSSGDVTVPAGMPVNFNIAAPAAGPAAAHNIIYALPGQPLQGSSSVLCGTPQAGDFAIWGPPIGTFGLGAFSVTSLLGFWTGGGGVRGFPLASSIPGIGFLFLSAPANGAIPCGNPVFSLPGILPTGFSFAVQAIVLDNGSPAVVPVSATNTVNIRIGTCAAPTQCLPGSTDTGIWTITNNTGAGRVSATVIFSSGTLSNPRLVSLPPAVLSRTVAALGSVMTIQLSLATAVPNGASVSFRVCTTDPNMTISNVQWQ